MTIWRCVFILLMLSAAPLRSAAAEEAWWQEIWNVLFADGDDEKAVPNADDGANNPNNSVLQIGDWPTVSLSRTEMTVNESQGVIEVPLQKDLLTDRRVQVSYRLSLPEGSAGAIEDLGGGQVVFRGDQDRQVIRLRMIDDSRYTPGRNATLVLSDAIGAELGTQTLVINIREDDPEPQEEKDPGALRATPNAVDFGEPESGLIVERSVKITNEGGSTVYIDRVVETADNVSIAWMDCASSSIRAGMSCEIELSYTAGDKLVEGALLINGETSNGIGKQMINLEIPLQGRITKPVATGPSEDEIKIARLLKARSLAEPGTISTVEVSIPEGPKKYRMSQSDISDENSPGRRVFDYPVDLSRVITTFQPFPCVIQASVNTQLAGTISCKIEQPVLGHHAVRYGKPLVLLEPETMAEGVYETLSDDGQTRINVAWRRFMRPDGSSIYLRNGFPGLDAMGRMGLHGPVDTRVLERIATPLALSAIVAGGTELLDATAGTLSNATQTIIVDGTTRVLGDMAERNLGLKDIMTIPARSRLLIKPTVDLYFKETEIVPLDDPDGTLIQEAAQSSPQASSTSARSGGSGSSTRSLAAPPTTH